MKTKIPKILGVALTLVLVVSLFGFTVPVAAQAGDATFAAQIVPTVAGQKIRALSNVGDIAVSNDGVIYAIDNGGVASGAAGAVLMSRDNGNTWTALAGINVTATVPAVGFLVAIAAAPDNSEVAIVTDGVSVYVTANAGTTWADLPALALTGSITDVDVSASIPGALLSRHYVATVADPAAGACAAGIAGVEIIGGTTIWQRLDLAPVPALQRLTAANLGALMDFMSGKFSPNYMGDRGLALVGATVLPGASFVILSQPGTAQQAIVQNVALPGVVSVDFDAYLGNVAILSILCADIALPSNWDPSLPSGQVNWVSLGSTRLGLAAGVAFRGGTTAPVIAPGNASDDVYRIDAGTAIALNAVTSLAVHSIAYSGTIDDGTLFMGERNAANVRYTLNPQSAAPTWKASQKPPSGDNVVLPEACTVVRVAPGATGTTVYAGTRDFWQTAGSAVRAAFSRSDDSAISFDQTGLINLGAAIVTLVTMDDVMPTPDGTMVFLSSDDGTDLSLWKSPVPSTISSWERIYCRAASPGPSIIRLAPDWDTAPSIFWADTVGVIALWVSHDSGAIFANRTPPALPVDLVAESGGAAGIIYITSGVNIFKSTNGGYFFGLAIPTNLPVAGTSLSMAPMYPALPVAGHVMVGATGSMAYSLDGAASFMPVTTGLALAGVCVIGADEEYGTAGAAGENMIYIAGVGGLTVYRFVIGTDTTWTNMIAVGGATGLGGIGFNNGALYAADRTVAAGVRRAINPHAAVGTITWTAMNVGAGAGTMGFRKAPNALRVANSVVWAIDTQTVTVPATLGTLVSWDDWLATASPDVAGPADGFALGINPVGGIPYPVDLNWPAMGTGTGLVNIYQILIWPTAAGSGAGTVLATAALGPFALAPAITIGPVAVAPNILLYPMGAGTEYTWMARAAGQVSGAAVVGPWSAPRSISCQAGAPVAAPHQGPQLLGPVGGATDVSLNPGFSWTPIAGATEYEFILATDSALTQTVEGTPAYVPDPAWQVPAGTLEYSTVYFWAVKATLPTVSPQSIGSFTTMAEPVEPLPPADVIVNIPEAETPAYVWGIIGVGAVLVIVVLVLIVRTRRPM